MPILESSSRAIDELSPRHLSNSSRRFGEPLPSGPGPRHEKIGPSRGLGEPILDGAGEHQAFRGLQVDLVTDTHEYGPDEIPRSQSGTNDFASIEDCRMRATFGTHGTVLADEKTLGASDGGTVPEDAQVTGQAEPPGMGHAVSIAENGVHPTPHFPERGEDRWSLAKGEEARDVGKNERALGQTLLDHTFFCHVPGDRRGDAGFLGERGIDSGDDPELPLGSDRLHPFAQSQLDRNRSLRRDSPPMRCTFYPHTLERGTSDAEGRSGRPWIGVKFFDTAPIEVDPCKFIDLALGTLGSL